MQLFVQLLSKSCVVLLLEFYFLVVYDNLVFFFIYLFKGLVMSFNCKISSAILMSAFVLTACSKSDEKVAETVSGTAIVASVAITSAAEALTPAAERAAPSADVVKKIEGLISKTKKQIKFPIKIDENVRWDDMKFDTATNAVAYVYTVSQVSYDIKNGVVEKAVAEQIKSQSAQICADPLTKLMLENDTLMAYSYADAKGAKASFTFDLKSICK